MNPDTFGILVEGQIELNTLRVNRNIFESGKKKLRVDGALNNNVKSK